MIHFRRGHPYPLHESVKTIIMLMLINGNVENVNHPFENRSHSTG